MRPHDAVARWPLLSAHLIAESLGYAVPTLAGIIILDAANGRPNYCEWMMHTFSGDARKAVQKTFKNRRQHRGFMADFPTALEIVRNYLETQDEPLLASWF